MHKMLVAVVLLSVGVLACGCNNSGGSGAAAGGPSAPGSGGAAAPKSHGTVGVSLLTMANPFFKVMGDSMQAEGSKDGYAVTIQAGEMDSARQKDQVNDFIVKKVSAIVLSPVDARSIGTSIQEANKAGIPVFTADTGCLDPAAKVVSHVATDNYGGGKLAGEAMVEAIGDKGTVAIITHPEVESVILRAKGFKEVIAKHPGIKIVSELPGRGERDTSFKTAQDILEKHPDLNGLFAINDPSALGAVAAIEKAGKTAQIKVVGFDGMPEAKQAIKDGKIYADIVQYPDKIGEMTIQSVGKYMAGEKVPPVNLIPAGTYKKADAVKDASLK
ncbi:MAG TPA: substrate-binding domain-containing protein [Chthonomonadaceae bacterium]|nr:substrate-binding domain-containing protein [Chthonomonadaceae bacterium]